MAAPYAHAADLRVRVANAGGRLGALAESRAYAVTEEPPGSLPTRSGTVATQVYRPAGGTSRAILLIPGIHSMGIEKPRLNGLAEGPGRDLLT